MIEVRSAPATLVQDAGPLRVEGYAATFGKLSVNLGGFREKIARGAFAKSIRDDDILALHHHQPAQVLGRMSNRSLSLHEDAAGLRFSLTLPDTAHSDIAALVQRLDIKGMSFAFTVRNESGEEWEEVGGRIVRTLRDVRLVEVSTTANPAYPSTTVETVRRFASAGAEASYQRMKQKMIDRGLAWA